MELGVSEAHLWYVHPEQVTDPALLDAYQAILSNEEAVRQRRFVFARDRHLYLVARGLLRSVLSRHTGVDPAEWIFERNEYGKPRIIRPAGFLPLQFNLSHTDGLVSCAVVLDRDVGVDVENVERKLAVIDLARRYFSACEAADVERCSRPLQQDRFFDYWTLKEAYIKARGLGLSLSLDAFWFDLEAGVPPRIHFGPGIADEESNWQFIQFSPSRRHKIAVAIRRLVDHDVDIVVHEFDSTRS